MEPYLGVLLFHERITNSSLRFVIEKVKTRLQQWDARKLSLAGRFMLPQSIFLIIPNYFMQTMRNPQSICEDIERTVRQLISGNVKGNRKMALLAFKQRLLTQVKRLKRGIANGDYCTIRGVALEEVIPATRDCRVAKEEKQGKEVLIQTDSLKAIKAIQILKSASSNSTIIRRIHHFLENVERWAIQYISKEDNEESD
ncbi:hypothetical protein Goshw_015136 [Gossypium schwendimanii]|uniref:Uncharacterized protein n=1 Tax=Gossypium schwendimanii TaxID=34291 RepID=A0A7J9KYD6_GOSSC|nr:hypothetical protein [Gossypium schwendimanii]